MRPINPPRQAEIHAALDDFHGHRGLAAAKLGLTPVALKNLIVENQELSAAWGTETPTPPNDFDVIRRTETQIPDPEDIRLAEHLISEDRKLARGLDELKLTTEEKELARTIGKFHQKQFFRSMDIIGGGVTVTAIKLLSEFGRVQERLEDVRKLISAGRSINGRHKAAHGEQTVPDSDLAITIYDDLRSSLVQEERLLYQTLVSIGQLLDKMFDTGLRGQLMTAGIRLKLLGHKNTLKSVNGKVKPGFTPNEELSEESPEIEPADQSVG